MKKLFELGQMAITPGSLEAVGNVPTTELARHQAGDWGDVCAEDAKMNNVSLESGDRLLSAYTIRGVRIWIITEADRSVTTVLLPEEY